ncbi:MAG: hypothetical protein E7319_03675 [Clostridiales bacterium]|nr:hypothetical protein [Clostridiales bacterium]
MGRRFNRRQELEMENPPLRLDEVLEPYDEMDQAYAGQQEYADDPGLYQEVAYSTYPEAGYADYELEAGAYEDDAAYDDLNDEVESEGNFTAAIHAFDVISSLVGVFVIFVLVAMLLTLVDWLRTDILHSFVLLQSGIR